MKLWIVIGLLPLLVACGGASPEVAASTGQEQAGPSFNGFSEQKVKKLYSSCKVCHGPDGKKMFAGASDLSASEMSVDERVAIIKYGKGKMLPYEGRLKDEEIRAVAEYIETFKE